VFASPLKRAATSGVPVMGRGRIRLSCRTGEPLAPSGGPEAPPQWVRIERKGTRAILAQPCRTRGQVEHFFPEVCKLDNRGVTFLVRVCTQPPKKNTGPSTYHPDRGPSTSHLGRRSPSPGPAPHRTGGSCGAGGWLQYRSPRKRLTTTLWTGPFWTIPPTPPQKKAGGEWTN